VNCSPTAPYHPASQGKKWVDSIPGMALSCGV